MDLTDLAYGNRWRGMIPSAGGCDEFIRLYMFHRQVRMTSPPRPSARARADRGCARIGGTEACSVSRGGRQVERSVIQELEGRLTGLREEVIHAYTVNGMRRTDIAVQ